MIAHPLDKHMDLLSLKNCGRLVGQRPGPIRILKRKKAHREWEKLSRENVSYRFRLNAKRCREYIHAGIDKLALTDKSKHPDDRRLIV